MKFHLDLERHYQKFQVHFHHDEHDGTLAIRKATLEVPVRGHIIYHDVTELVQGCSDLNDPFMEFGDQFVTESKVAR